MSNEYQKLLQLLSSSGDSSADDLVILSSNLSSECAFFDALGLSYEIQAEGVRIDLSSQNFKLFKTKESAVNRISIEDFDSDILIIEEQLIFIRDAQNISIFFENVYYWHKFKSFLLSTDICSHDDIVFKAMIFLSEKLGKLQVGYQVRWLDNFYSEDLGLKSNYELLENKITNDSDFKSFFRDNFLRSAQEVNESNLRYTKTLKSIAHVIELSVKDFDLFKSKFSFEDFRNDLEKEKEKYFKDYQASLTDFLSKVASMPVQFGAYVVLILRFEENLYPLLATLVLIVAWSVFKIISVNQIIDNVVYLKAKFNSSFDDLLVKSNMAEEDIKQPRTEINQKFDKTKYLLQSYNFVVIVFTLFALVVNIYFVSKFGCPLHDKAH